MNKYSQFSQTTREDSKRFSNFAPVTDSFVPVDHSYCCRYLTWINRVNICMLYMEFWLWLFFYLVGCAPALLFPHQSIVFWKRAEQGDFTHKAVLHTWHVKDFKPGVCTHNNPESHFDPSVQPNRSHLELQIIKYVLKRWHFPSFFFLQIFTIGDLLSFPKKKPKTQFYFYF